MKTVNPLQRRLSRCKFSRPVIFLGVIFLLLVCKPGYNYAQANTNDSLGLVALYDSAGGPGWRNNTNWLTQSPLGTWYGVTVNGGRVTGLNLTGNKLSGSIPQALGNLVALQFLLLAQNQIIGSLPASLGNLLALQNFSVTENQLTGPIPPSLGNLTNLQALGLGQNQLSGTIPPTLGNLVNLTSIDLSWNKLSGSMPSQLGALTKLTFFNLQFNQLTGAIPSFIAKLVNLNTLILDANQLSGTIPAFLGNMTNLRLLSFSSNQLSGSIPPQLGRLTQLTGLGLYQNQLSGSIPDSLSKLVNLTGLSLTQNQLSGNIPASLGKMVNLQGLDLSQNQLTGSIPASFSNLGNLQTLSLSNNQLTGAIPGFLGGLTKMYLLFLNNNKFSGSIPSALSSLTNLVYLNLNSNQLSGGIPAWLGNFAQLQYLELAGNELSGPIPPALGNITNLFKLDLSGNQLSGNVPASLYNFANLNTLFLYNNKFTFTGLEGIAQSYSRTVFLNYAPQAPLAFSNSGSKLSVSAGGTPANNTYNLYLNGMLLKTQQADSVFNIAAPGKYSLSVTNSVAKQLTLMSDTFVYAGAPPVITISANPGTNICGGTVVTFTDSVTNNGSNPVYQWKKDGKNVGNNSGTYKDSLLKSGDFVTCVLTVAGKTVNSNELIFTVSPVVTPSVTIIANTATTICQGVKVTFTAKPVDGGASPTYQWKKDGKNVGINAAAYSDSTLNTGDSVNVVLNSNANCLTANTAISKAYKFTVNALLTPTIEIKTNKGDSICQNSKVTFTATVANAGTLRVYQWQKNGKNVGVNSATYTDSTINNGDLVTCALTVTGFCTTINTVTSAPVKFTVFAGVPGVPSAIAGPATVQAGTVAAFKVSNVAGVAYIWEVPAADTIMAGQGTDSIAVKWGKKASAAVVSVKASNPCGTSAAVTKNISVTVANGPVFVKEVADGNALDAVLYPNPAATVANLRVSGGGAKVLVTIADVTGKTLWRAEMPANTTIALPSARLSAGMYFVTVTNGKEIKALKMVKGN